MTSQPASPPLSHGRRLAVIAAAGFGAVGLFQLAIVLGAPLGTAAWGGAHSGQLPFELRLASAFSASFWTLAALRVLSRGGIGLSPVPYASSRWGTWVLQVSWARWARAAAGRPGGGGRAWGRVYAPGACRTASTCTARRRLTSRRDP